MKYLILIHHNPDTRAIWDSFTDEQQAAGMQLYLDLNRELMRSGELVAAEALADPSTSTLVQVREGGVVATDGPFSEAKEHLGGFYLVDVDSLERAIEIAARIPEAQATRIEVRPIMTHAALEM
jgi:hypothetical protein